MSLRNDYKMSLSFSASTDRPLNWHTIELIGFLQILSPVILNMCDIEMFFNGYITMTN